MREVIAGTIIGAVLITLFHLLTSDGFYCRIKWHQWRPWQLTGNGGGQYRTCQKCGLWDVRPFVTFTITEAPIESKKVAETTL